MASNETNREIQSIQTKQATIHDLDHIASMFDQYRIFYGQFSNPAAAKEFIYQRFVHNESIIFIAYQKFDRSPLDSSNTMDANATAALGFTQLYPSFSSVSMQKIWILNDLFVVPEARNQGVANQLLLAAKEFSKLTGAIRLELTTAKNNFTAQRLYEFNGYEMDDTFLRYSLKI